MAFFVVLIKVFTFYEEVLFSYFGGKFAKKFL